MLGRQYFLGQEMLVAGSVLKDRILNLVDSSWNPFKIAELRSNMSKEKIESPNPLLSAYLVSSLNLHRILVFIKTLQI